MNKAKRKDKTNNTDKTKTKKDIKSNAVNKPPKGKGGKVSKVVHFTQKRTEGEAFAPETDTICGIPGDRVKKSGLGVTDVPELVTCGLCRKVLARNFQGFRAMSESVVQSSSKDTDTGTGDSQKVVYDHIDKDTHPDLSDQPLPPSLASQPSTPAVAPASMCRPMPEADKKRILYTAYSAIQGAQSGDAVEQAISAVITAVEGYYSYSKNETEGMK